MFVDLPIARQGANLTLFPLGFVRNPMFPQDDMVLLVAPRRTQDRREGMQRHRGANPMMVKLFKDRSADRPLVASPPLVGPITPAIPYPNFSVEAALRSALSHRTYAHPGRLIPSAEAASLWRSLSQLIRPLCDRYDDLAIVLISRRVWADRWQTSSACWAVGYGFAALQRVRRSWPCGKYRSGSRCIRVLARE